MQKVEGSSPFSRFGKGPAFAGLFLCPEPKSWTGPGVVQHGRTTFGQGDGHAANVATAADPKVSPTPHSPGQSRQTTAPKLSRGGSDSPRWPVHRLALRRQARGLASWGTPTALACSSRSDPLFTEGFEFLGGFTRDLTDLRLTRRAAHRLQLHIQISGGALIVSL
jgi:hypothetical protein